MTAKEFVKQWYPNSDIEYYNNGQYRVVNGGLIIFNGSANTEELAWCVVAAFCKTQYKFWVCKDINLNYE